MLKDTKLTIDYPNQIVLIKKVEKHAIYGIVSDSSDGSYSRLVRVLKSGWS